MYMWIFQKQTEHFVFFLHARTLLSKKSIFKIKKAEADLGHKKD